MSRRGKEERSKITITVEECAQLAKEHVEHPGVLGRLLGSSAEPVWSLQKGGGSAGAVLGPCEPPEMVEC